MNYKLIFSIGLFVFTLNNGIFNYVIAATPKETSDVVANYDYGNLMLEQILSSVRKDKFKLYLNFDISMNPNEENSLNVHSLEIKAVMLFKSNSPIINIPLLAQNPKPTPQDKKLALISHLEINNRYAVLHLKNGTQANELIGQIKFYVKNTGSGQLEEDFIKMSIDSELIDVKLIQLYGANIKIQLPQATMSKKELKNNLFNLLAECKAKTETLDVINWKVTMANMPKCQFSFDGIQPRFIYADPEFNNIPLN